MKNRLISVILPIWQPNLEHFKACIESVVNQSYDSLEIIIVYRKSKDFDHDFYSIMNEYHDDKRIKIIENKKIGFTNSLNEGIVNSTGELIGRIDGDDCCEINRFEKQLDFKDQNEANVVGSWAYHISDVGEKIGKIETPVYETEIRKKIMFHNPMLHSSILMEKKMITDIGMYNPEFNFAEDYELWLRAISRNYKLINCPEYLISIREASFSIMRGTRWRKQRYYNIKAKNQALLHYGFATPQDIIYYTLSSLSYFISPKISLRAKKITGWYKSN